MFRRDLFRRNFLHQSACGFGAFAAASLFADWSRGDTIGQPTLPVTGLHHAAKAKRVIFLFMQGGVSQVDSFDPKPLLDSRDGEMINFDDPREVANQTTTHEVFVEVSAVRRVRQVGFGLVSSHGPACRQDGVHS